MGSNLVCVTSNHFLLYPTASLLDQVVHSSPFRSLFRPFLSFCICLSFYLTTYIKVQISVSLCPSLQQIYSKPFIPEHTEWWTQPPPFHLLHSFSLSHFLFRPLVLTVPTNMSVSRQDFTCKSAISPNLVTGFESFLLSPTRCFPFVPFSFSLTLLL